MVKLMTHHVSTQQLAAQSVRVAHARALLRLPCPLALPDRENGPCDRASLAGPPNGQERPNGRRDLQRLGDWFFPSRLSANERARGEARGKGGPVHAVQVARP